MRRDQTRAPETMRSTLPNTDQPRIPHSEYHYNHHPPHTIIYIVFIAVFRMTGRPGGLVVPFEDWY